VLGATRFQRVYRSDNLMQAISVVVITHNEGLNLRHTVENLQDTLPPEHEKSFNTLATG